MNEEPDPGTFRVLERHGDLLIVETFGLFNNAFNVYRHTGEKDVYVKVNDLMSFFTSIDAARDFIREMNP